MSAVSPDFDAYGKYARPSALADYLEVLALTRAPITKAALADYINDNDWELQDLVLPVGVGLAQAGERRDGSESADLVFSTLQERRAILGNRYPFEIRGERLVLHDGLDIFTSAYLALLSITTIHAYGVDVPFAPHQLFEATVADVLGSRGLLSVNFGAIRRDARNFEHALETACASLRLYENSSGAPRMRYAQDENVDVVCHLHWGDRRSGAWTMIGQVTCAKSEQWEKKIKEPSPTLWNQFLSVRPRPLAFLAVPHHVDGVWFDRLVCDADAMVLDRLRLTMHKDAVLGDERLLIQRLAELEFEGPFD